MSLPNLYELNFAGTDEDARVSVDVDGLRLFVMPLRTQGDVERFAGAFRAHLLQVCRKRAGVGGRES